MSMIVVDFPTYFLIAIVSTILSGFIGYQEMQRYNGASVVCAWSYQNNKMLYGIKMQTIWFFVIFTSFLAIFR